ncbi:MAG: 8-oxo-dGTP diphosphatase [Oscillospiraceae bacterium]|nr:8-oxo-dGTP diphosphatase [Oscillospiraceae bacterium]
MKRTENAELTVLCLVYRDDEILLQNRIKKDWQGYTLPGGHVEQGESITEAVKREMKEETGLDIYEPKLCGVKQFPIDDGRYIVFLYKTDKFSGELISSDEGKMEWVKRSEIAKIETVSDFELMLRVFDEDSLSEFQYVIENGEWIAKIY